METGPDGGGLKTLLMLDGKHVLIHTAGSDGALHVVESN